MQIIPGLRKIKAQYPYTEDSDDSSSSDSDENDNVSSITLVLYSLISTSLVSFLFVHLFSCIRVLFS
jgi:hypothetical protein